MSSQEDINPENVPDSSRNSKDAMFDPKPKPKMIRVLTVLAYVLSVSMAAILLSIYYIFMWDGKPHIGAMVGGPEIGGIGEHDSERQLTTTFETYDVTSQSENVLDALTTETSSIYTSTLTEEANDLQVGRKLQSLITEGFFRRRIGQIQLPHPKMSYKSSNNNGIKITPEQWKTASVLDTSVKFAGEEAKDRLYEPKHKKKLVRVLTVVAYVFFVSLAAIMLSLYYVFLWNGDQKIAARYVTSGPPRQQRYYAGNCDSILAEMQQQFTAIETEALKMTPTPSPSTTTSEENITWSDEYESLEELRKSSAFVRKIMDDDNYEEE